MRTPSGTARPPALWELFDGDRQRAQHRARVHRPASRRSGRGAPRPLARARRATTRPSASASSPPGPRASPTAGRARHRPGDRVALHARAVAALLRRPVRRDEARRDRGAAVHAVRPRRPAPARRRLHAATPAVTNAEKADIARGVAGLATSSSPTTRCSPRSRGIPRRYAADTRGRRSRRVPVHLGHHARAARGGEAHAPRARHADVRRALRHRHPPGRPVLLPVVARPGATASGTARWPARAGRDHRHLRGPVRSPCAC